MPAARAAGAGRGQRPPPRPPPPDRTRVHPCADRSPRCCASPRRPWRSPPVDSLKLQGPGRFCQLAPLLRGLRMAKGRPPAEMNRLLPLYDIGGEAYFGYRMVLAAKLFDRRVSDLLAQHGT